MKPKLRTPNDEICVGISGALPQIQGMPQTVYSGMVKRRQKVTGSKSLNQGDTRSGKLPIFVCAEKWVPFK